ncbi:MAG TPA: metal-sensing transcriptional repressor [Candidatus Faecaligallichristensenella faecipullorum]|nr:metal-sensing transcriptional repressor [Candidatus Faecaligallichristensenella faecipullorum]
MQANKAKLNQLIKTARGQLDGILKMIEEDAYCIDVSNQLMAADAILRRANREVLSAHLSGCVRQALESGETGQIEKKLEELDSVLEKLSK